MRRAAILLALFLSAPAHAAVPVSSAEQSLLDKLDKDQLIKARTEAEAILDDHPDSFVANWAMARVHHDEEGNHARAVYFVKKAEDILLHKDGGDPAWHKKVLLEEASLYLEMNRNADVLATLDRYDQLYGAAHPELRIWPLFKLGKSDEARAIARHLTESDDWEERALGYNGMLSIEYEAHDRAASYQWAVDGVRATQERSCTIMRNGAGAAYTRFRLAEAEDLALRAHQAEVKDCTNSGYDQLAGLYIIEGEFNKALAALNSLKSEHVPKRYRPHFALQRRSILADLLAALGKVDDAEHLAAELYTLPQRTGMTSSAADVERFARTFRYWASLDAQLILLRERRSYAPPLPHFDLPTDEAVVALARWEVRRVLITLAAEPDSLINLVRPNLGDINDVTPWRVPGLIDVLGTGVFQSAVDTARRRDAEFPEAAAYLDSFAGEIAFRQGRWADADKLATSAVAGLPREEAMLRWRTMAWHAQALWKLGLTVAARASYQEVLRNLPSALRFLDLQVPASITDDGSALGRVAAERLHGSSRFEIHPGNPFHLDVSAKDGAITICLTDENGFQLACGTGDKKATQDETVENALAAFHDAAFSPKVAMTQSDLQSLDGSPVRVDASQVLKDMVEP